MLIGLFIIVLSSFVYGELPTDQLISYYPFDYYTTTNDGAVNRTIDQMGFKDGTGYFQTFTNGAVNQSYNFTYYPAIGGAINFSNNQDLFNNDVDWSISLWAYPFELWTDDDTYNRLFTIPRGAYGSSSILMSIAKEKIFVWAINNVTSTQKRFSSNNTILANRWHHIVLSYNGSLFKFYVNGLKNKEINGFYNQTSYAASEFAIGGYANTNNNNFRGAIDQVAIYHKELNITEIKQLYAITNYSLNIDNCSDSTFPYTENIILNITSYEENNLTRLGINNKGIITYKQTGDSVFKNYTFEYTDRDNYLICAYPRTLNITLDAYFQYDSQNGYNERYYIQNSTLTNTTEEVYLYNFNGTEETTEILINAYTYYYSAYVDIIGKLQRYYISEDIWRAVQIDKVDNDGQLFYYIREKDTDYRFLWEYNGELLDQTQSLRFDCTVGEDCEQTFTIEESDPLESYRGMAYYSNYDNLTGVYSFTWSDSNNLVQSIRLIVDKTASDKIIHICDTTVESSAGTINCNTSAYDGIITAKAIRAASPEDPFFSEFIEKATAKLSAILKAEGRENEGIAIGILMMIMFAGFGAISPALSVIGGIVGLVILFYLGLMNAITFSVVLAGVLLGAIVAFLIKK